MSTNVNEDRKRLKDLINEAVNLERELKQEQEKRKFNKTENLIDSEDAEFLRNSLKDIYEDIILIDLKFANENNIEEKLWRYVFYNPIEELRQKLRRINKHEKTNEYEAAYLEMCRYLDLGNGFYHTIVNNLKIRENINFDQIGIEIFKNSTPTSPLNSRPASKIRKKELSSECIQRCLINLGDLARYREMIQESNDKCWEFARQFYTTAARVYCDNGKAQAQLALLSMLRDKDIDIVYWYCFSLSTKQHPSTSLENLKVFYTKFTQRAQQNNLDSDVMPEINNFQKKFLEIHRCLFEEDIDSLLKHEFFPEDLITIFEHLLDSQIDKHNLILILKKFIFILIFTIWDIRNGSIQTRIIELRNLQLIAIGLSFGLLTPVINKFILNYESGSSIELEYLAVVSLWCQYLGTLVDSICQFYTYAKSVENETLSRIFLTNLKNFFKSVSSILNHPKISFLLGVDYDLLELAKNSVSEDLEFLGVVPLRTLQQEIIFTSKVDPLKIRIARLILFGRKMAENKSFDIFCYNESTGQYILVDEETKKKERQRTMKLLAQQFLQDQVNSLENNLQKIGHPSQRQAISNSGPPLKKYVVDTGVMLNHLNYVKKWVNERKYSVIVPLDVIDSLDLIKKGNSQENVRAREAIRYLDQQIKKSNHQVSSSPEQNHIEHFIRAQQIDEKLPQWAFAEGYLVDDGDQDNQDNIGDNDQTKDFDEEKSEERQRIINSNEKFNINNIPKMYRPMLSCWLYYARLSNIEEIFFVTEDQELTKYSKMFGLPVVGVENI
ncbi:1199_t:CDS:10 [Diversispora eburnea]|uniref:1199_t:CDS:1 n=1 Tax=Diversispora eburnea TaxID=1213867 RepID=A0A9N9AL36_9GLOM|nr:1199_t:CDS:10 [Diversispora eburnea]